MRAKHANGHRRAGLPVGVESRGERGASLIIALAVILLLSVIASAVLTYAETAYRGTGGYRNQRDERYAGDGAISSAVNYAKQRSEVLVDPDLSAEVCRQEVPTEAGVVTVSCEADEGSGSGAPEDVGLVPPESLLLLGTRHNQPGPYNAPNCEGWWDGIVDFFSVGIDPDETGDAEPGAFFGKRYGQGLLNATCNQIRTRPNQSMAIRGNTFAAGRIVSDHGLNVVPSEGIIWARHGCSGPLVTNCTTAAPSNRAAMPGQPHLAGTRPDTDPGRRDPNNAVNQQSIDSAGNLDVATAWQPVGFNADGTPRELGYAMPMAGGNQTAVPERTMAYTWNSATNVFTPQPTTCPNNTATMVFLPGWYRNAEVLSRYTTASACKDVNFWFAPNPGPDGVLLTDDDETGAFYFDFTVNHSRRCGPAGDNGQPAPAHVGRWCVGGAPDQNARIVGGTPLNWSPIGTYTEGTGSTPDSTRMVIDTANTVDLDLSQSWRSSPEPRAAARQIGGTVAHYRADFCIPFIGCLAQDRAIRLRDLTPRATSPAMALPGAPNGRVYLTVRYAVENPNAAQPAEAVIEAVSAQSGRHQCGTYALFGNAAAPAPYNDRANAAGNATNLHDYTFTDAQAEELASRCGALDRLNGLEVKVQVRGNTRNQPRTDWFLDGIRIEYDTVPSATFPEPVGANEDGLPTVAARSDCDPTAPGVQFAFGGSSHVYVADGSIEICAGPHPDDPANRQAIGLWALPPVNEVAASNPVVRGGHDTDGICIAGAGITDIDGFQGSSQCSQADRNVVVINYGGCAFCTERNAPVNLTMGGYTPPSGYRISRVEARISYNPKNSPLGCNFLSQCTLSAHPHFEPTIGGSCGRIELPRNPDRGPLQFSAAHQSSLVMYDGSRNCVGVTGGGASLPATTATYWARANCPGACIGPYRDTLDGVRYQITIEPTDGTVARIRPQSGCTVNHPNYDAGYGVPDCAVVRADTGDGTDNWSLPWATKEGQWRGRFSVKGTIWAPGSAIEVDDSDVAYPLATRGAIMRHLRVSGWGARAGYTLPAFDNQLDLTPAPREGSFVACLQSDTRRAAGHACGDGAGGEDDKILSRARAFFTPFPDGSGNPNSWNWDADIQWWDNRR